ncbi:3-oxoacyl-[acyl-carrier-protein] reductase FabG [Eumeta japonica]|uniref:3-oxoacyl-[acyl-carrier-protein] reductase FabG n=1 Tax=Eumeta variegata TaxID=151549 RepID=A0A4C1YB53_EUMVA|nr:3-oxoacyl-[acyl-carrier-protein] reductase FabG [Eumeta japonica]
MDFNNKVVIVTGASSGIGAATAEAFAKLSASVVLVGRNAEKLRAVAQKCENAKGKKPLVIKADMSVDFDVKKVVFETVDKFSKIDVLVNNAGFTANGGIRDGIEIYDKVMSTNVRGVYLLTSLAVPHLVKTRGNIVNVSSIVAKKTVKSFNWLAYSMSKAALDHFTRCVALELASEGVRVNAVNPGAVRTPFYEVISVPETMLKKFDAVMPLGKIAESEEIADMIVYLASDKARSITGVTNVIDNGNMLI